MACLSGAARADGHDILVRIAPDSSTAPVNSQTGYTISITNATTQDLAFDQIRFLLPGHGGNPVEEDILGEPKQSKDRSPAFDYLAGSTTGLTTSDPTIFERWLTWGGGIVGADSTSTLHFLVGISSAPAYYVSGATVDAPSAIVLGTRKGAQVQVLSASAFALQMGVNPEDVDLGETVTYTATLTNNTDQNLTVERTRVAGSDRFGEYVPGSTTGAISSDPVKRRQGRIWEDDIAIAAQSAVEFSFRVRTELAGIHRVQGRAFLTEPLPDGQSFAGTGPTATVTVH